MNPLPSKSSRRRRTLTFEKMESRRLLTATAGGLIESDVSDFNAESDTSVKFRIAVTDASGRAVTDVRAAEDFFLNVFVEDVREDPGGVFAAYLDLAFDSTRTFRSGDVVFGDTYSNVNVPGGTAPGLLDEVGGVSGSLVPLGEGEFLLFRAPFRANSPGTLSFVTNPADRTPSSLVLVYGAYEPLQSSQIDFGSANINVLPAAPVPTLAPTSGSFATAPTASFGQYLAPSTPPSEQPVSSSGGEPFPSLLDTLVAINSDRRAHQREYEQLWGDLWSETLPGWKAPQTSRPPSEPAWTFDSSTANFLQTTLESRFPARRSAAISINAPDLLSVGASSEPFAVSQPYSRVRVSPGSGQVWLSVGFQRLTWEQIEVSKHSENSEFVAQMIDLAIFEKLTRRPARQSPLPAEGSPLETLDTLFALGIELRSAQGRIVAVDYGMGEPQNMPTAEPAVESPNPSAEKDAVAQAAPEPPSSKVQ